MSIQDSQNIPCISGRELFSSFFTYEPSSLFCPPDFPLRRVSSFELASLVQDGNEHFEFLTDPLVSFEGSLYTLYWRVTGIELCHMMA
jgi:hypothetical protein